MVKKVGFIGLGMMGLYMAKNLIKAGNSVTVFDVNQAAIDKIDEPEAQKAKTPTEVASKSEIIISMVTSTANVQEIVTGPDGILKGMKQGSVYIDMSTILPTVTKQLSKKIKDAGFAMLDAPVSRGQMAAINGTLSIMVGGEKDVFEHCLPILKQMGTDVFYCGPNGNGAVVKLVNNLLVGIIVPAISEALVLGVKGGLDLKTILQVVQGSSGTSWMLENYFPNQVFKGNFKPGFKADLMKKDLGLINEFASDIGMPLFLGAVAKQLFEVIHSKGMGELDQTAFTKFLEEMVNVKVRLPT
jgi:3-hydroxyisobutyrate dehydrogenase